MSDANCCKYVEVEPIYSKKIGGITICPSERRKAVQTRRGADAEEGEQR